MILYAESSALLTWLLGQDGAEAVEAAVSAAGIVIVSDLSVAECHRTITREHSLKGLRAADAARARRTLAAAASGWQMLRITPEILERVGQPFPAEPLRTLDAIHVASALHARAAIPDLAFLTLDSRIRNAASQLGFEVLPAAP